MLRSKKILSLLLALALILGLMPMTVLAGDTYEGADIAVYDLVYLHTDNPVDMPEDTYEDAAIASLSIPDATASNEEPGSGTWVPNTARTIVRGLLIDIWGYGGLLHTHNVYGIVIPSTLFDLVETDGWEAWFMTYRAWEPAAASPFSATAAVAASGLAWDHPDRIQDLDQFFSYFEAIFNRAVYRMEAADTLGLFYLTTIEPSTEIIVLGFVLFDWDWNEITQSLSAPMRRILQDVLSPAVIPIPGPPVIAAEPVDIYVDATNREVTLVFNMTENPGLALGWIDVTWNASQLSNVNITGSRDALPFHNVQTMASDRLRVNYFSFTGDHTTNGELFTVTATVAAGVPVGQIELGISASVGNQLNTETFVPTVSPGIINVVSDNNNFIWGDVNGDGDVDWDDLFLLIAHLNDPSVTVFPGADVNADGTVDWDDLFLLIAHLNDPSIPLGPQTRP